MEQAICRMNMAQILLLLCLLLNIVTYATQKNKIDEKPSHNVISNTLVDVYSKAKKNIKKKCPICFEEMKGNRQAVSTICGHLFCQICMERIKENFKKCPLCNNKYFLSSHLILAIKDDKLREAEHIIRYNSSSVDQVDTNNNTPLMHAAFFGKLSFVQLLLYENANVNVQNHIGLTALMKAVYSIKRLEPLENPIVYETIVKLLLQENANVKQQMSKNEISAIHLAVFTKNEIIVEYIIKYEPTCMEQMDGFGYTALHTATYFGEETMVKLLLNANANVNAEENNGYTHLFTAIIGFKNENPTNSTAYENIVKLILLQKNIDIDQRIGNDRLKGATALMVAVLARNKNMINQLIEKFPETINKENEKGTKALDYSFMKPYNSSIATLLIEKNLSDINRIVDYQNSWTPLFCAVFQNDENFVKFLLKNGANTKHIDKNGKLALSYAKEKKFTNIVNLLPVKRKNKYFCVLYENLYFKGAHIVICIGFLIQIQLLFQRKVDYFLFMNIFISLYMILNYGLTMLSKIFRLLKI